MKKWRHFETLNLDSFVSKENTFDHRIRCILLHAAIKQNVGNIFEVYGCDINRFLHSSL